MKTSPDIFPAQPRRGAGVRRINRVPMALFFGVFVVVMAAVGYTVIERTEDQARPRTQSLAHVEAVSSADILARSPEAGLIERREPVEELPPSRRADPTAARRQAAPPAQPTDAVATQYDREWEAYRQQQAQIDAAKLQAMLAATTAPSGVTSFGASTRPAAAGGMDGGSASLPAGFGGGAGNPLAHLEQLANSLAGQSAGISGFAAGDESRAAEKAAWLQSTPDRANYLPATRTPPASPFELKAGAVIPGIMIGGINSDLPGQIIGQVREHVWDTATGRHLLIPQGARLVGTYDNQVTRGQKRVLVAWTRIIFPDGSSLSLGKMPGADQAGYSGFAGKVNNHTTRVFGDAILLSLFGAAVQLSQPQATVGAQYDPQQMIAGSLGQQIGEVGSQLVQRNMSIQPTIEIRPGLRFNVTVTQDIILPPWQGSGQHVATSR